MSNSPRLKLRSNIPVANVSVKNFFTGEDIEGADLIRGVSFVRFYNKLWLRCTLRRNPCFR